MGRAGLINSGGASSGESDLKEAVKTAVINKRAGGMGLISGRKAFQRPMKEGVALLNAIQDVYSNKTHHGRVSTGAAEAAGEGGRAGCSRGHHRRLAAADAARLFGRRRVHGLRRSRHPGERPSASSLRPALRSRHRVFLLVSWLLGCSHGAELLVGVSRDQPCLRGRRRPADHSCSSAGSRRRPAA